MKSISINFKDWLWVAYPAAVVFGIFAGLVILFGDNGQRIANLTGAQEQLEISKAQLARLQQKERLLQSIDVERETVTLIRLTGTMPVTKKVWLLVSELADAGTRAGAVLTDLNGEIGDVKEASGAAVPDSAVVAGTNNNMSLEAKFSVADFRQVRTIVERLSRVLPLVKINELAFNDNEVMLVAEGAWSNWGRTTSESNNPLPDIMTEVTQVEAGLADFEEVVGTGTEAGEFVAATNPF